MQKVCLILVTLFNLASASTKTTSTAPALVPAVSPKNNSSSLSAVYDQLDLAKTGLQKDVFEYALRGWQKMKDARPVLSIVDLSQPSTKKRLYVVDLQKRKLLFNTYVSHGRNSGDVVAKKFSNINSSFQTSLGFYQTLNTYMGRHGLSLQLKGLEKGFNDNAYNRNIVLHGADYVCEDFIRKTGRLGRSQGCPAVPNALSKDIILAVKGGSCLFVYSPDSHYLKKSAYLSNSNA
ncbi:murein L,D-transpeptidase catalytic domain family protein [Spirosoma taeanense]|uniref:Murein L,D-transpeptidase catalytic domain family protein n=1 Tax=Spirosoma taeanense TaxID=2735870 RepID=A0A6M5YCJ7_9BACT|nr:murein L,D-transpeptidase catalytic domain family protein [Spirosoma taeanense]QJW90642.1 murein L,D-transpeptidase catalytic domain family protein [Spirosoma taeanense]